MSYEENIEKGAGVKKLLEAAALNMSNDEMTAIEEKVVKERVELVTNVIKAGSKDPKEGPSEI